MTKRTKISILVALLVLAALIAAPFILQAGRVIQVRTAIVDRITLKPTVTYTGQVQSGRRWVAAELRPVLVEEVPVRDGQSVEEGAPLIVGYALDSAGQKAGAVTVSAPFSGIVTGLSLSPGSVCMGGTPFLTLCDPSSAQASLFISASDASLVNVGQGATVSVLGKEYAASVSFVSQVQTRGDGAAGVAATVSFSPLSEEGAQAGGLLLGADAVVKISVPEQPDVLAVSVQAIRQDAQGRYCMVLGANNEAARRGVSLGLFDGMHYAVTEGLSKGEKVILNPPEGLKDGQIVLPG